jgi:hypothetical protein
VLVWVTAFALIYDLVAHYCRGTVTIWIGVMSHWVLDWITHRSDMPLYPAGSDSASAYETRWPAQWQ